MGDPAIATNLVNAELNTAKGSEDSVVDFAKVAQEAFQILQQFNYKLLMYDENDGRVTDVEKARRFFAKRHNLWVSLKDDDDNSSVSLQYGPTTHANDIMGLDQTLRAMATKFGLLFSARQGNKTIEPRDFPSMAAIHERKKMSVSTLTEGMYGTSMSSYLRLENAKMIVRHKRRIDDQMIGARGRYVESIFIENAQGERLLFPSTQLAPARAMTQHVNHGGTFGDDVGGQIMQMTEEYANLSHASNFMAINANLSEDVMPVREACRGKMRKMRKTFERIARPSSYMAECNDMVEKAKGLKETATIDETRLTELRRLLNDADLPNQVYECMCKAVDEMKAPIEEANIKKPQKGGEEFDPSDEKDFEPPKTWSVRVLGQPVDKVAWDDFAQKGRLALAGSPRSQGTPRFRSVYAELCYKLGSLIPVVKDESMQRLLQFVLDDLSAAGQGESKVQWTPNQVKDETGRTIEDPVRSSSAIQGGRVKNLIKIAVRALKAAHVPVHEGFTRIGAAQEYFEWLDRFRPEVVLREHGMDPYSKAGGLDFGDAYDTVLDDVFDHFDAEEFVESPEMLEVIDNQDAGDPDETNLNPDDIKAALRSYLYQQANSIGSSYGVDEVNVDDLAEKLYSQACEALQDKGYVVDHQHNPEASTRLDLSDEPEMDRLAHGMQEEGIGDDGEVLSREDILTPKADQGDSLAHEVTKTLVRDPTTRKMKPADASYVSQLSTIAHTTAGPNGQAY